MAAAQNLVPVTLELGGKSPQLVFADADLDAALPVLVTPRPERGPDLLGGLPRADRALDPRSRCSSGWPTRFRALRVGPASATSTSGR